MRFVYSGFCEMPTGSRREPPRPTHRNGLFFGVRSGFVLFPPARVGASALSAFCGAFRCSFQRSRGRRPSKFAPILHQNPTNFQALETSKNPTTKSPNRENCPACEKLRALWVCRVIARNKKITPGPSAPQGITATHRHGQNAPCCGFPLLS